LRAALVNKSSERGRCLRLLAGQNVAVDRQRDGRRSVPEALGDDMDGHAGLEQQGRVRMSQVVEPDGRHARRSDEALEPLSHVVGDDGKIITGWSALAKSKELIPGLIEDLKRPDSASASS
jgi:hypothetical protein